jgi:hypothetical protein
MMKEKDIENLLANHPDDFFRGSGFELIGQQVRLGRCFADILFKDKFNRKIIVEIKSGILSRDAAGQIMEYYGLLKETCPHDTIELILIANTISRERSHFLENAGIECREIGVMKLIEIAKKYNYIFLDTKKVNPEELEVRDLDIKPSKPLGGRKVWIFQANPNRCDIVNALRDDRIAHPVCWLVNQRKNEIKKGDIAIIWMSGKEAGIYSVAKITSDPYYFIPSREVDKYWVNEEDKGKDKLRVKTRRLLNLLNNPVFRTELISKPGLKNLSIFKQSQGTNFQVLYEEWKIIGKIIQERSRALISHSN